MKIKQVILLISFLSTVSLFFSSCKSDKDIRRKAKNQNVIHESKRLNKYLDDVFDSYVERHPEYQSFETKKITLLK